MYLIYFTGDFAVLLQSGMSYGRAAFFNFTSALTAVVGFFIAVLISTDEESIKWIFTLAAGLFLYMALADMVRGTIYCLSESHKYKLKKSALLRNNNCVGWKKG